MTTAENFEKFPGDVLSFSTLMDFLRIFESRSLTKVLLCHVTTVCMVEQLQLSTVYNLDNFILISIPKLVLILNFYLKYGTLLTMPFATSFFESGSPKISKNVIGLDGTLYSSKLDFRKL